MRKAQKSAFIKVICGQMDSIFIAATESRIPVKQQTFSLIQEAFIRLKTVPIKITNGNQRY